MADISVSRLLCAGLLTLTLVGCSKQEPIQLGFVGGTSGRGADLGIAGRNGTILAIEQVNAAGGIQGQPVSLLLEDDQQDVAKARQAVKNLIDRKVAAIIGPMTSSMAMATVNQANEAKVVMMGATVATNDLAGKDDYFFRTISPSRHNAQYTAQFLLKNPKIHRLSAAFDMTNRAYTMSWLGDFKTALTAKGGELIEENSFESGDQTQFSVLAERLLASKPDAIVIVANAMDSALLIQQIRNRNAQIPLATSEWAGTDKLLDMGGKAVEGLYIPQYYDRESTDADFRAFHAAYVKRFAQEPGFPGLIGYKAARVLLDALAMKKPDESLKQTLLRVKHFKSLLVPVEFDAYGETETPTHMAQIQQGKYKVLSE